MIVGTAGEVPNSPRSTNLSLEKQEYEREFIVLTDDYGDGPNIVVNAIGVPSIWQAYSFGNEYNTIALCRKYTNVERLMPNSLFWRVVCYYSSPEPGELDVANQQNNPLLQMPEIAMEKETYQQIVYNGYSSSSSGGSATPIPMTNSAGETFDPPPMMDASRLQLVITRYEDITTDVVGTAILFTDAVNSDVFWGQQPGTCKCQGITCERISKQLQDSGQVFLYLKTKYVFHFRTTWQISPLDAGSYYNVTTSGVTTKVKFTTSDGHPIIGLLNGMGGSNPSGSSPVYAGPVTVYQSQKFGLLNLPQNFQSLVGGAFIPS